MRASRLVVVVFLVSSCSPDEPDNVAVVPEPPARGQVDVLQPLTGAVPPVQVQVEEECRELVALEAHLQEIKKRYTERHPEVIGTRSEIARLRSALPADGTFCSEQLEQRVRAAVETRPQ